ncbi:MAG: hypothetical protein AB1515_08115 [Nitrospirota bacterium]
MTDWERVRRDLLAGAASLTAHASRAARRTGREFALVESRAELIRVERELARRYQGLGEAAYEEWQRAGALTLQGSAIRDGLRDIAALAAQRDRLRREISDQEPAAEEPEVRER